MQWNNTLHHYSVQCIYWHKNVHHHSIYTINTDKLLYKSVYVHCMHWPNIVKKSLNVHSMHWHNTLYHQSRYKVCNDSNVNLTLFYTVCTDTILYTNILCTLHALTQYCTWPLYVHCMHWHNTVNSHSIYIVCTDTILYMVTLCTFHALKY